MENLAHIIAAEQQRFDRYQTYEELCAHNHQLQEEYPELVRIETVGHGADRTPDYPHGRPIEAMIIANPKKEAERPYALKQIEHENELPATLDQQLTAEVVCKHPELLDELGYNLILLNTTHPDGIALQRWVVAGEGEFDPLLYALWFYRSAAHEQIAWGYPFQYKNANFNTPTPEVQASMDVMQRYKPDYLHSVHASGIDDVYFYLTHPDPHLMAELTEVVTSNGLDMQQGEPEVPYIERAQPGFYHPVLTARAAYDYRARHLPPAQMSWNEGTTSAGHLSGVVKGPFVLLSEMPYLTADVLRDASPSGMTRREVGRIDIATRHQIIGSVASNFEAIESQATRNDAADVARLVRSIKWWYKAETPNRLVAYEKSLESPTFDREATKAEAFGTIQRWEFYCSLFLGEVHHLASILGQEGVADNVRGELESRLAGINTVSPLQTSSLPSLVGAQALSGLVALQYRNRLRPR